MSTVSTSAVSVQPEISPASEDRRIVCAAGIRSVVHKGTLFTTIWVRSPRTGNVIEVTANAFYRLRKEAPRVLGRIAQFCSLGRGNELWFTPAELKLMAEIHRCCNIRAIEAKDKPINPSLWHGWRAVPTRFTRRKWAPR